MDREIASHDLYRRIKAGISPRTNLRRWRMARLEARQVRTARHLVAVSRRIRRDLVTRHGVPDSRITVIPNGVDTARFAPDRAGVGRDEVRRRLGIADGLLLLGAAHNLRLKGMDNAIRALSLLRASAMKPEPHLAIAGGAPDPFWRALATRLGVADRVHFLGQVDDMVPLYGAADVYVHPTRWDACSLSTIEAGAAGLPVITTAMNGAAELIEDGRTGFVLRDPEDVGTLADHLRRLSDPVLRRQIGDAALAASSGHDIRDNLRAVEAVLVRMARQEP
jgi:glycosyltransferase involved in cell wall biosynthesis